MLDQLVPSQRATLVTLTLPATENIPPANTSVALAANALTLPPLRPLPNANQLLPFHRAMLVAATPPAFVNRPATNKSFPRLTIAPTLPSRPLPNPNQFVP